MNDNQKDNYHKKKIHEIMFLHKPRYDLDFLFNILKCTEFLNSFINAIIRTIDIIRYYYKSETL